jgi:hypothetical protein
MGKQERKKMCISVKSDKKTVEKRIFQEQKLASEVSECSFKRRKEKYGLKNSANFFCV